MSEPIEISVTINGMSASLEIYHQARLQGALDYHTFTTTYGDTYHETLNVFFDNPDAAMLFKLAHGGAL